MKKLAIIQIVLGILVIASLIFWAGWVSSGYHRYRGIYPGEDMIRETMGLLPVNPYMVTWVIVYFIVGLAVLGCGITQYLKARHQTNDKKEKQEYIITG